MTTSGDPKGYYAALGVKPAAKAGEIKTAYRKLALAYHPDRNKTASAKEKFYIISAAYEIIGNEEKRAAYDRSAVEPPQIPANTAPQPYRQPAGLPPDLAACCRCGAVSAQPRYVIFWSVYSFLVTSHRRRTGGVYCRACADRAAMRASLTTWVFGWWGLPYGPFHSLDALLRNMLGGDHPSDENARLLGRQAMAFVARGNVPLARAALDQALTMAQSQPLMGELMRLQAGMPAGASAKLVDRWRPSATRAFYVQLAPFLGLILFFMYFVLVQIGNFAPWRYWARLNNPEETLSVSSHVGEVWHVSRQNLNMHSGPSSLYPVMQRLPLYTSLRLLNDDSAAFMRVVAPDGTTGYVDRLGLDTGEGEAAWRDWCGKRVELPPMEPLLLKKEGIGQHTLRFHNSMKTDALVKLRDKSNATVLLFYVRTGVTAEIPAFPEGMYKIFYATGKEFSPACGLFLRGMKAYRLAEPVILQPENMAVDRASVIEHTLADEMNSKKAVSIGDHPFIHDAVQE